MDFQKKVNFYISLLIIIFFISGCSDDENNSNLDIEPFIEYAEASDCIDIRNRLFIIDDELLLWDRVGNCPDNSYEVQLFKDDLDNLLCETHDSIAGPVTNIYDEDYRGLFESILDYIEEDNLGLDSSYLVEEVNF